MVTPEQAQAALKTVKRKMRRFIETGDLKRLTKLKVQLTCMETDLELQKEALRPKFRKSYQIDFWSDGLLRRHKPNPFRLIL
jgi:hypothetical protein